MPTELLPDEQEQEQEPQQQGQGTLAERIAARKAARQQQPPAQSLAERIAARKAARVAPTPAPVASAAPVVAPTPPEVAAPAPTISDRTREVGMQHLRPGGTVAFEKTNRSPNFYRLRDDEPAHEAPVTEKATIGDRAYDVTATIAKGAMAVPEGFLGLADLARMAMSPTEIGQPGFAAAADKWLGFRPKQAREFLEQFVSDPQKRAKRSVQEAEGFIGTAKAALSHPSVIAHTTLESLPLVLGGAGVARGAAAAVPRLGAAAAGAIGEGAISAGSMAEHTRQEQPGGVITLGQAAASAGAGVGTAILGRVGAKVAKSLKIADVETMLVAGSIDDNAQRGLARRIVYAMIQEGALEELPQSVQEQIFQNVANGAPLAEGVDEAAVLGALAGAVMGGGAQVHAAGASKFRESAVQRRTKRLEAEMLNRAIAKMKRGETLSPEEEAISAKAHEKMLAEAEAAGTKKLTPEEKAAFEAKAAETMLERQIQRAAAGEKVPGFGQSPREPIPAPLPPPETKAETKPVEEPVTPTATTPAPEMKSPPRPVEPRGVPGPTRIVTPPDMGSSVPPDDRVTIGEPVPPEGKRFPVTAIALKDFATEKGISIDDAAARMRAANYDVSDETIEAAGGTKAPAETPATDEDARAVGTEWNTVQGGDKMQMMLAAGLDKATAQAHYRAPWSELPQSVRDAVLASKTRAPAPAADVSPENVKSVININGFGDFVTRLVDEKGLDQDTAERTVVQKYRELLDAGTPAKDAKGEMRDVIDSMFEEEIAAPVEKPVATEVPAPKKKRGIERKPEAPKAALPEGYKVARRGDEFVIEGPHGHLRSRSWKTEDEALVQGKHAIEKSLAYDWGQTPFAEIKKRIAGLDKDQLIARSDKLVEEMRGLEPQSPEYIDKTEELEYIDHEVTRFEQREKEKADAAKRESDSEAEYKKAIAEHDPRHVRKPDHMQATVDDVLHGDAIAAMQSWLKANPGVNPIKDGMPDDVLQQALDDAWGQSGHSSKLGYVMRGKKSWRIDTDAAGSETEFKGAALLKKVRELVGIPRPGEGDAPQTKAKKPKTRGISREEQQTDSVEASTPKPAQDTEIVEKSDETEKPVDEDRGISRKPVTPQVEPEWKYVVPSFVTDAHKATGKSGENRNDGFEAVPDGHGHWTVRRPDGKVVVSTSWQTEDHARRAIDKYTGDKSPKATTWGDLPTAQGADRKQRVRDRVVKALDDKAAAARARIEARGKKRLMSGLDPEELADYAIIGAAHMARGVVELGDWSAKMLEDFGDSIKPHLRKIFGASIQTFNDEIEAAEKEIEESIEPQSEPSNEVGKTEAPPAAKRGIDRGTLEINPDSRYADEEGNEEESLLEGGIRQARSHYRDALELKDYLDSGKGPSGRKLTPKQRAEAEQEYRRASGLYVSTLHEIQNAFGEAIREGVAAEIEGLVDESPTPDILGREGVTADESLRDNVEGGASEQRPEDVSGAEGERAPGSDGGGRGAEGGSGVSGRVEPPGEGESAPGELSGEGPASSESGVDGPREGVGVDRDGDDGRVGSKGAGGRRGVRRRGKPDAGVAGTDYTLTDADAIGEGGERAKARANIAAIELALKIKAENRPATREEQAVLAKYVGWGGLKPVFEPKGEKFYQEIHDKLKELLTDEEFKAARATILNAHYTSPTVVRAMWDAVTRLGFRGGKVLEPGAGVGNFIGFAPADAKGASHFTAVERDRITATIAGLLYPEQNVVQSPFEKFSIPDGSIDLAIGNPPFGDISIRDKNVPKELTQQIHDYFFVRAVNALRPGGVLAFVTSDGTMDKASSTVRKWLAEQTVMVAAIRLPNTAFQQNARTSVTTDIIILQKKGAPDGIQQGPAWRDLQTFVSPNGNFRVNEYYVQHPQQMLGVLEEGGQYSRTGDQQLVPKPGQDLEQALRERLEALPRNIMTAAPRDTRSDSAKEGDIPLPEGAAVRDGGMTVVGGEIMRREGNQLVPAGVPKTRVEVVKALIGIRDAVNVVRRLNTAGAPDAELEKAQKKLRDLHEAFVKKHGPINAEERIESEPDETGEVNVRVTYPNLRSFEHDPESPFVRALEIYDYEEHQEKGAKYRPKTTDIMHRRTIAPRKIIDRAETPTDALISSLNERGRVDLPYMAQLLRQPEEFVRDMLKGRIYQNPANDQWETADQYLSGNVKKKLAIAEAKQLSEEMSAKRLRRSIPKALEGERPNIGPLLSEAERAEAYAEQLKENIAALQKVIPADLPPSKIAAVLGAPWVPPRTIQLFAREVLGLREDPTVTYNKIDGTWRVEAPKWARNSLKNQEDFGTKRIDGVKLLGYALNMQHPVIVDRFSDGTEQKNVEQTIIADEKMEALKEAFSEWLWKDDARAEEHVRIYNDTNNTTVIPNPIGDHLTLPGAATHIDGRPFAFLPHQRNFIARFLYWGRAAAFHVVGAGKTFASIGALMEAKRLGLVRKPVVAVPNHMLGQWTREFLQLYPGANLLVATERDFEKSRRREFTARMASSDYDAIIMTHSAFEKIPMSLEAQQAYLQQELDDLSEVMSAAKKAEGKNSRIVKDLVKAEERLRGRLEDLQAEHKKDDLLDFEELGVDHITVDEAHAFKNLQFNTALQGVKGRPSQRAVDLEMKLRYLHKINPKHSAMLLTGTPISNTFSEAYVMQRYMQPEVLQERGLFPFDAWAKTFARERMAFEMKPDGSGFKQRSRFDRFVNLGEFAQMFRSFADIQMAHPEPLKPGEKAEDFPVEPNLIRLERPPLIGGKPEVVLIPKSPEMADFMMDLMARAQAIKGKRPEKGEDNMLSITNDGRLGALDLRTVVPDAEDSPHNKISIAAEKIASIYHESTPYLGTQLVFSDILRSSAKGVPGFDVYDDLIAKLVKQGVPRNEIAKIHDHDSAAAKLELFMKVRAGKVRILIGSTEKMGAGTNVQTRLVAEHQLDVRWRPSDVEQREGRILRQGNQLLREGKIKGVRILRYATEGSIDAFQWGTVTRKAGMIQQGMTADVNTREIEDIDDQAMTYAEISAAASGDPRIIRRAELDAEVGKLERLRRGHVDAQWHLRQQANRAPESLKEAQAALDAYQADAQTVLNTLELGDDKKLKFKVEIRGKVYEGENARSEANKALVDILKGVERGQGWTLIGKFAGLSLQVKDHNNGGQHIPLIGIEGKALYDALASTERPVASLEALPGQIPKEVERQKDLVSQWEQRVAEANARLGAEFPQQAKLDQLKAELQALNIALSDKKEETSAPKEERDSIDDEFYGDDDADSGYSLSPASRETRDSLGGTRRGPSIDALGSPAAEPTPLGKRIRTVLGMKPAAQTAAVDRVKSLRTIVVNLSKMVDVPIRQGRFLSRQRKARGVFFIKPEVARIVRMDMLDTAAHEVGHYVSKHYLEFPTRRGIQRQKNLPKLSPEMKKELVKLGKDLYGSRKPKGGYGEEGIAEWTKFYVTAPGKMASDAPEFTNWMETHVLANEPGLKAALDQARQDFAEYRKAPATARVDAMMDVKPAARWRPTIRGFINAWLDDLYEFKLAVEELGADTLSAAKNAYLLARLSRGGAGVAGEMVENGVIDARSGKRVTRGLKAILEDVGRKNIQKFRRYLIAERAIELAERGIDAGIELQDAIVIRDMYRNEFGELAEELWEMSQALIRYRAAKGLLTPEEAKQITDKNQRRVGFYRVFEDDEHSTALPTMGVRGFARNSSGLQKIKGSSRAIIDPLESLITDIYKTVQQSHAAEVMRTLVKQAEATEGGGRVVEILTEVPKRAVKISVEDVKWQLQDLGIQVPNILDEQSGLLLAFENLTQGRAAEKKDLVMPVVIDGKRKWVQLKDARLYDAISGLGTPQMPMWLRAVSIPTRTLRAGATLTPEFSLRNPFRDMWQAARYSKGGLTVPGYHLVRGIFHLLKNDGLFEEWRLAGGDNSAALGIDRPDVVSNLYSLMHTKKKPFFDAEIAKLAFDDTYKSARQRGLSHRAASRRAALAAASESRGWVLRPIDTLRMLSSIFENATRLTEYERVRNNALKRGASRREAEIEGAFASRDLTLDFNKAGIYGRQVNQLMAFFNANLLGWQKDAQEFENEGAAAWIGKWAAYLTVPSLLLWAYQKDDEEYKKVPEWQKAVAWIIIDRDEDGNLKHIWRIPKPAGPVGLLFGTAPVKIAEYVTERDPRALEHIMPALKQQQPLHMFDAFLPLIEWWANKSAFTGRDIVPEGIEKLPAAEQATARTGEMARQIGRGTNLSPAKIENTVKGYTGGLGQYGMDIGNVVTRFARDVAGAEPFPKPPQSSSEKFTNIPGIRGFTVRKPQLDAQPIQDALDAFKRADGKRIEWRRRVERGDKSAAKYFEDNKAEITAVAATNDGMDAIGPLRLAHDAILDAQRASRDAEPAERERLSALALEAAEAALKNLAPSRGIRRDLRRSANQAEAEGQKRLRRIGRE